LTRFSGRITQIVGGIETGAVPILSAEWKSERLRRERESIAQCRRNCDFCRKGVGAILRGVNFAVAQYCAENVNRLRNVGAKLRRNIFCLQNTGNQGRNGSRN
jgi:hypothetical protein